MATVPFVKDAFNGSGDVWSVTLSAGDESNLLTFMNGEYNVNVIATGTIAGSTVTVQQSFDRVLFGSAEAIDGTALALTTIGVVKRVASAATGLKVAVSGGTASGLVVSVYAPKQVRP